MPAPLPHSFTWVRVDDDAKAFRTTRRGGPKWRHVVRRITSNEEDRRDHRGTWLSLGSVMTRCFTDNSRIRFEDSRRFLHHNKLNVSEERKMKAPRFMRSQLLWRKFRLLPWILAPSALVPGAMPRLCICRRRAPRTQETGVQVPGEALSAMRWALLFLRARILPSRRKLWGLTGVYLKSLPADLPHRHVLAKRWGRLGRWLPSGHLRVMLLRAFGEQRQ